ncbi:MAG TPA: sulfite exporter TauE/SafE family protein [candidate division Zixibacteria bacterium]|nr:sulfite exporter TauE/SafE family protein [candidate division Zixibacteria bacterium]
MFAFAGEGFFLGLSLGVSCLGTCLPVILPYLFIEQKRLRSSFASVLWFLIGRFIGYISFGAIAGALGGQVPQSYREPITGAAYIVLACLIIYNALRKRRLEPNCPAKKHAKFLSHPILFGLILGFNPCPAFLIASGRAFESGGALAGALFFATFFVGTSVFFLPLSLFGELAKMKFFRITAKILAVIVALWFMFVGVSSITVSLQKANRPAFQVVDPLELEHIYLTGDSASALYFQSIVDKSLSAELLYVVIDSIPDGAFAVHFGVAPDTSKLMSREIGIMNFPSDSTSVESAVNIVKTYGFKKEPGKGFYFETGK